MTNRREFIKCGLTFSSLSLAGISSLHMAVASPEGHMLKLESFVSDLRFRESISTAETLASQGVPIMEVSGDMTDLWINQYSKQWKQKPMSLAGVTGRDALFVLETLAPDYGMRVVHKSPVPDAKALAGHAEESLFSWIIVPREIAEELS